MGCRNQRVAIGHVRDMPKTHIPTFELTKSEAFSAPTASRPASWVERISKLRKVRLRTAKTGPSAVNSKRRHEFAATKNLVSGEKTLRRRFGKYSD